MYSGHGKEKDLQCVHNTTRIQEGALCWCPDLAAASLFRLKGFDLRRIINKRQRRKDAEAERKRREWFESKERLAYWSYIKSEAEQSMCYFDMDCPTKVQRRYQWE